MRGYFFFSASAFNFLWTRQVEGKGCRLLSITSGGAFGMHASGSRERVRGTLFSVCAPPGFFYGRGVGEEERVPAGLPLSDDAFSMHVSGPGGRALTFNSYGLDGAEGNKMLAFLSSQQRCFWYTCQRTGKAITRKTSAFCVFTVKFSRTWWERRKRSTGNSLLSTTVLGTHAADREDERAGHLDLLRVHRSVFTDWVGGGEKDADDS